MRSNALRVAIAGFVVVITIAVALWRSNMVQLPGQSRIPSQGDLERQARDAASELYDDLGYVSVKELNQPGVLESTVGVRLSEGFAKLDLPPELGGENLDVVLGDVLGVIRNKWLGGDADAYIGFLADRGYVPRSLDSLIEAPSMYLRTTGEEIPSGASPADVYRTIMSDPKRKRSGMATLEGIADSSAGFLTSTGEYCAGNDSVWPSFDSEMGPDAWYGGRSMGFVRFFKSPGKARFDRIRSGECIKTLSVGMVMQFRDGRRLPVLMLFLYDSGSKRWWFDGAIATNAPEGLGGTIF